MKRKKRCIRRCELHVFRDPQSGKWIGINRRRGRSPHRRHRAAIRVGIRVAGRRRVEVLTNGRHGRFRWSNGDGDESSWHPSVHTTHAGGPWQDTE